MSKDTGSQSTLLPRFGADFLQDHAGRIIVKPEVALVELVANAWDAGADQVNITWPDISLRMDAAPGQKIAVTDNGTGMSDEEFTRRWLEFKYNRRDEQGDEVIVPLGNKPTSRRAFGRNGKGRHGMFCFCNAYEVETWRQGISNRYLVSKLHSSGVTPFQVEPIGSVAKNGHGTVITGELLRNVMTIEGVRSLLGTKFATDPGFAIRVNDLEVQLQDLEHFSTAEELFVPDVGIVIVRLIDSQRIGRTTRQHGIAWWVNKRLVGEPSWKDFRGINDSLLDGRNAAAKRFTFVIEADILKDFVREDWTDFVEGDVVEKTREVVRNYVLEKLSSIFFDVHRERKRNVVRDNREILRGLPAGSRLYVGKFLDLIQNQIPSIKERDLDTALTILAKLEQTRSGFELLDRLVKLAPNDFDQLNDILKRWTVQDAAVVLNELERRLKVIKSLEAVTEDPKADELHVIHPLFEGSLWIFGPEYESISFISNRTLVTVVKKLFGDDETVEFSNGRQRPDHVGILERSISVYSRESYDERSEPSGYEKVLIIELKRGGARIGLNEQQQAQRYALELSRSGKIQKDTRLVAFVLGTEVDPLISEPSEQGNTKIFCRTYNTVVNQAHARTFNLLKHIKAVSPESVAYDQDIEEEIGNTRNGQSVLLTPTI
jgi:hypothetical protein